VETKFASEGGHLENAEQFVEQIRRQERCDLTGVVGRGDFDKIATDDIQPAEGANEFKDLDAGETADLRSACAGGVSGIDGVDIESDVDGLAAKCAQMALNEGQTFFVKLLSRDHFDFVFAGEVEIVFAIDLSTEAHLQDAAIHEKTFFKGAAEGGAMRILAAEIFVPQVVVSVELDERDGAVLFGDGAKDGETDGVIAAHANAADAGLEKRSDSLLDAEEGVFDGKRVYGKIAEVGYAIFGEGIYVEDGVPGADDGGLDADVARTEARAGAIGGAAVERDADEGDLELFGLWDVREAHEGGDAGEASILQSVEGVGMWQPKLAAGLRGDFGHGEAY